MFRRVSELDFSRVVLNVLQELIGDPVNAEMFVCDIQTDFKRKKQKITTDCEQSEGQNVVR